jgi:hypothetical protein
MGMPIWVGALADVDIAALTAELRADDEYPVLSADVTNQQGRDQKSATGMRYSDGICKLFILFLRLESTSN